MKTKEIPKKEWSDFFDSFSRKHEGWLITMEILGQNIGAQIEERELTLEGITYEGNETGDTIIILTGAKPEDHIAHSIQHPTTVGLQQTEEGADVALAISSADGVTALLQFRSPMLPEWVDGLVTIEAHISR